MQKVIYLDNAATSWPKPPEVALAMTDFITNVGGNAGRSGHKLSIEAARIVYLCRTEIADLFGVADPSRVVFLSNATHAINFAVRCLASPGTRIVSTMMEHNSVARVLEHLKGNDCVIDYCPCESHGFMIVDKFTELLKTKAGFVIVNHASNVTGSIQDIKTISKIAHKNNAFVIVDAAQTAGILPINMKELGIDILAFTGHKGLFGPQGTGGLVFSDEFDTSKLKPVFAGGTGSQSESTSMPDFLPDILETGTLNCPGIAGLLEGVRFVRKIGIQTIHKKECNLRSMFLSMLKGIPGIRIYGLESDSTGVVSITADSIDNSVIGSKLDKERNIMSRVGLQCAPLAHKTIGTYPQGTVRFSVSWFTQAEEIAETVECLRKTVAK